MEESPMPQDQFEASVRTNLAGPASDSVVNCGEVGHRKIKLQGFELPLHVLESVGRDMHHYMLSTMGGNNRPNCHQILPRLQATGDEVQQLQAVFEMCQVLVMENKETLRDFPVKEVVAALMNLLKTEHNFDLMNQAYRALIYMMEAFPGSSALIVVAVPVFLKHSQLIQHMFLAEQALIALDMLSCCHNKAILNAEGVFLCLMYFDCLSVKAQQTALSIVSNCFMNLRPEEFHFVVAILPQLASLLTLEDKNSVESVCLVLIRLTDSLQDDLHCLIKIFSSELITNLQELLVASPPVIGSCTFIAILRTLSLLCIQFPELAVTFLKQNFIGTLLYLMTGNADAYFQEEMELIPSSFQEFYEITCLIGNLMPGLPADGIFSVDILLEAPRLRSLDIVNWQWSDDRVLWNAYSPTDSRAIELAHLSGDDEINLHILGQTYIVHFHSMQQINEGTGTSRFVQRRCVPSSSIPFSTKNVCTGNANSGDSVAPTKNNDVRVAFIRKEQDLIASIVRSLFSVLHKVFSVSADRAIRRKCIQALLRMVYCANAAVVKEVLNSQRVSSHIAGMMASNDLHIVVGALQLVEILMSKLPNIFGVQFSRDGVMYQISQLANLFIPGESDTGCYSSASTSFSDGQTSGSARLISTSNGNMYINSGAANLFTAIADQHEHHADNSNINSKENFVGSCNATSTNPSSFSQSLNADHRERNMLSSRNYRNCSNESIDRCGSVASNKEKARNWVREQASRFIERYSDFVAGSLYPAGNTLSRITEAVQKLDTQENIDALRELRNILIEPNISMFEASQSGLIKAMLSFLALVEGVTDRDQRLRNFLHIFAGCPLSWNTECLTDDLNPVHMSALVAKLQKCVSLLEQFPVKMHDHSDNCIASERGISSSKCGRHNFQFKLQCYPGCTNLKQWKEGILKFDPFTLVEEVERCLVNRGYDSLRSQISGNLEEDNSGEDRGNCITVVVNTHENAKHRIQLLIGNNILPRNMTLYEAVTLYSRVDSDQLPPHTDDETPLSNVGIWTQIHTIYYRLLKEETSVARTSNSNRRSSSDRKRNEHKSEGVVLGLMSPLSPFLTTSLPVSTTIRDASLEVMCLLRILHALNRYWNTLYAAVPYRPILPNSDFLNREISAKASRQLRYSLVTGDLPSWIHQIAAACPFLFTFEIRQLLFHITSFDRDASSDSQVRMTPQLRRYRKTVTLKHAGEKLRCRDLQLWHNDNDANSLHVNNFTGLFPAPLGRSTKALLLHKIKTKFRFIGSFMAEAVMSSKMLNVSFSMAFYRWILGQEHYLTLEDLSQVEPAVYSTLVRFQKIIRQRDAILSDATLTCSERKAKVELLELDGCSVSDLRLNFVLPGYSTVELQSGGAKVDVNIHNLDEYVRLVTHWYLREGVSRQMEALREGFESVFPLNNLRLFYPEELEEVFCGNLKESTERWDFETLMDCCRFDHGYTSDSRAIRFLFEVLSTYNTEEQRLFVQFVTGSPRLPVGGFKSLTPPLTIVRKTVRPNMNVDDFLPSVTTCANYLKLPDYSTVEVMRAKLKIATTEEQNPFL